MEFMTVKRRREIGPKQIRNRSALVKFVLLAVAAAVIGSVLFVLADRWIGPPPKADSEEEFSRIHLVPGMVLTVTLLTALALWFFGVRVYMTGTKARQSMLSKRGKITRR